jgi:hypothetical protein
MAAIRLSERELEALHGLPFAAVSLYVLAIRQRMDYATGIAGERPRLSYQALSEWCRVESRQGVAEERLSRHQLARLLAQLERAGLIRRRPSRSPGDHLVFRCPLADRDSSVRKNPAQDSAQDSAQNPAQLPHRENPRNPAQDSAQDSEQNPAQHPGISVPMDTSSSSSTTVGGRPGGDDDDDDLVIPQSLTPMQQASVRRLVRPLNGRAQAVIDELAGYLDISHQAGKPIRSPLRYLAKIIEQAREPGWEPAQAPRIAEARARYQQTATASSRGSDEAAQARGNPEAAAAALAAIREKLKRGGEGRP